MPTVQPGSKILVTGASGFIAVWIVKYLLQNHFMVRGTVRSEEKGEYLKELFKEYGSQFEYVIVEDMSVDGAFDEAVKGMDAIEHTASPFHFLADNPDEIIKPAVLGTLNILESALKFGGVSLKRVVVLSSTYAIIEPVPEGQQRIFTEKDWNEFSIKEIEEKGKDAAGHHKYKASKTLAEKGLYILFIFIDSVDNNNNNRPSAAWKFMKVNAEKFSWDLVTINPPFVLGPPLHDIPNIAGINTSLMDFYRVITGELKASPLQYDNWVDVRDVAEAHIRVLTTDKAGGERFIIAASPYSLQDILDAVHSEPSEETFSNVPRGSPGADMVYSVVMDSSKAKNMLGLKFITIDKTVKGTARNLLSRQW
ncbi:hypothetical protein Clacol_007922 [Clathrus columnatus]|uniref:NAD-dependent epimerase/dehydratase domain-containing protein n=1 Tax=Clathrus columnatus TaxID=1419009 RepID=A0AAV5AG98_9AGAM|nr:hypothetical protein Clacol_007922 [Clathrus columnatus]